MLQSETCNVFSKTSSIVLRAMFQDPAKKWTANQIVREGISFGQANHALYSLEKMGLLRRVSKGRGSYSQVWPDRVKEFKAELLKLWTQFYNFERNKRIFLHDSKEDFLARFRKLMENHKSEAVRYAFTSFSGAARISAYVLNQPTTLYVDVPKGDLASFAGRIQDKLGLLRLMNGGNVCLASPYYGDAAFYGSRILKGDSVVSNLQLYLDLHSHPAGREQIEHLQSFYKKRGEEFV